MSSTSPVTELLAVTIDSPDASKLAHFYAQLTDGEVTYESAEYGYAQASLLGSTFNFQTVKNYSRPEWPGQDHPQQYHLDFRVSDVEVARAYAEELGASVAPGPESAGGWLVMLDPDGHPFCLCPPRPQE